MRQTNPKRKFGMLCISKPEVCHLAAAGAGLDYPNQMSCKETVVVCSFSAKVKPWENPAHSIMVSALRHDNRRLKQIGAVRLNKLSHPRR